MHIYICIYKAICFRTVSFSTCYSQKCKLTLNINPSSLSRGKIVYQLLYLKIPGVFWLQAWVNEGHQTVPSRWTPLFLSTFLCALMESAELHGISTMSSLNSPVPRDPSRVWVPKTLIIYASHHLPTIHPIMLLNILLPSWFQLINKFLRVGAGSYICILHCTHISLHFDHY